MGEREGITQIAGGSPAFALALMAEEEEEEEEEERFLRAFRRGGMGSRALIGSSIFYAPSTFSNRRTAPLRMRRFPRSTLVCKSKTGPSRQTRRLYAAADTRAKTVKTIVVQSIGDSSSRTVLQMTFFESREFGSSCRTLLKNGPFAPALLLCFRPGYTRRERHLLACQNARQVRGLKAESAGVDAGFSEHFYGSEHPDKLRCPLLIGSYARTVSQGWQGPRCNARTDRGKA